MIPGGDIMVDHSDNKTRAFKKYFKKEWKETIKPFKSDDKNYSIRFDSHSQSIIKGGNYNGSKRKHPIIIKKENS